MRDWTATVKKLTRADESQHWTAMNCAMKLPLDGIELTAKDWIEMCSDMKHGPDWLNKITRLQFAVIGQNW